jgi:hypothetical protein
VAAVRKLIFVILLIAFSILVIYGVAIGDFSEMSFNGGML